MSLFLSYASIIIAITAKSFLALFVQEHEVWTSTWFLATAQISLDREHITMASGGSAGHADQYDPWTSMDMASGGSTEHGHLHALQWKHGP